MIALYYLNGNYNTEIKNACYFMAIGLKHFAFVVCKCVQFEM